METYCVELASELRGRCALEVVVLEGKSDSSTSSLPALVAFAGRAIWTTCRRVLCPGNAPDVVHIGDMAAWPLALPALAARGTQVVLSAHGTDISYHRRGGFRGTAYRHYLRLGARLLAKRARIIANSPATADVAAETGWRTAAIVPLATRSEEGPVPQKHNGNLLFAGRLIEQKGCRWFVENVLPILPTSIGLKVAGPVRDPGERSALDLLRVEYLGALDQSRLRKEYREALAVIVPNIELPSGEFEGFGLVAAEAAAAGALVLAARTGGLTAAVLDGETGFLVPSGDAEAWCDRILEVADWSEAERSAFTTSATVRAREYYNWSRVADEVVAVYRGAPQANQPR